jgi:hypothetical protein
VRPRFAVFRPGEGIEVSAPQSPVLHVDPWIALEICHVGCPIRTCPATRVAVAGFQVGAGCRWWEPLTGVQLAAWPLISVRSKWIALADVFDDLDELVEAVTLAAGEVDELLCSLDNGASFGRSCDQDAAAAAELE